MHGVREDVPKLTRDIAALGVEIEIAKKAAMRATARLAARIAAQETQCE
jgi:hypothetical protein